MRIILVMTTTGGQGGAGKTVVAGERSLNEVLALVGLTKARAATGRWLYLRGAEVVHEGTAGTCWDWLFATGQVRP